VLQYTDAGNCFSDNNDEADAATGSNIEIVQVAATTDCPRQLIRRKVTNWRYIICAQDHIFTIHVHLNLIYLPCSASEVYLN